ncbi:MAG: YHS domain-containing protein [Flavisolibacter sp.]|jgi:YHS domain-containing protein|nr:YHS domain-containing protein [Flavisolibacter sp.]
MKAFLLTAVTFIGFLGATFAQTDQRKKEFNLTASSLAIQGYDPVAYFLQGKAVEGSKSNAVVYEGLTYYFSSAQNKEAFKAAPAKYEPQNGGWCAYAMGAKGEKVSVDPKTYKIVNEKLYLFYNKYFTNTLKSWNKDEVSLRAKADASWTKFFKPKL